MRLTDEEQAMVAGALGEPRRWAIEHQIMVGEFFDAADLVPVSQAHVMADTSISMARRSGAFAKIWTSPPPPKPSAGSASRP